jgi:hypothetical protein
MDTVTSVVAVLDPAKEGQVWLRVLSMLPTAVMASCWDCFLFRLLMTVLDTEEKQAGLKTKLLHFQELVT